MLADPDVVEAILIRLDHRLQILFQNLVIIPVRWVKRHHEKTKSHGSPPFSMVHRSTDVITSTDYVADCRPSARTGVERPIFVGNALATLARDSPKA